MKKGFLTYLFISAFAFCYSQRSVGFTLKSDISKKQIEVLYNGKLLTAYCYYDSVFKPILFPVNTVDGITVTRGYPIAPRAGDKTDHPHHTGLWMNYESVNGLDFWNNSNAIEQSKKPMYGTIFHDKIIKTIANKDSALITVTAAWKTSEAVTLLNELTTYTFKVKGARFYIDRRTKLTAAAKEVIFKDVKDGFFAIRVARELEMPSKEDAKFIDAHGNETTIAADSNGVTGWYLASNGKEGDSVWSTKGRWTMLTGKKQNEDISITIFDHPSNPGYPTYWHARGYGLFAANPLGRKIFSGGKEELNLVIKPNASVAFHYLVMVQAGTKGTAEEMNEISDSFEKD